MKLLINIYIKHIMFLDLLSSYIKKLHGSLVAKLYISNNSLRPTVPDRHSKSLLCINLYTHKNVVLTLFCWATAVFVCVDTIVERLLCLPRVNNACNNLLCLEKLGSSLKSSMILNIEYHLCRFGCVHMYYNFMMCIYNSL